MGFAHHELMLDDTTTSLQISDKKGRTHHVRPIRAHDRAALELFYATFEPKQSAQGLPPRDTIRTRRWLDSILGRGVHVIAESSERELIGHLMLVPAIGRAGCVELATFVHQSMRNQGIGTLLNGLAVRIARTGGNHSIWLSVEPSNKAAMRSYEKVGFRRLAGSLWAPEVEMELTLDPPVARVLP